MNLIPFPKEPLRAWVIIPADDGRDFCRVVPGGWPIDGPRLTFCGPLQTVLRRVKDDPRGVPVTIHPECERRVAA